MNLTFLKRITSAYRNCLNNEEGDRVLAHYGKFCHYNKTTHCPSAYDTAVLEGRRQAYLYLLEHIKASPARLDEIERKYRNEFSQSD